jgi:hypothetical protein
MPNVELWIQDLQMELHGDEIIATDYAIAEIGNFAQRKAFRSINFNIPLTANNKRILENPDIVNNISARPYRRLKARVYQDGADQQISFADIESVSDIISIRLYGGNSNFFELIKSQFLSDIESIEDINHVWNLANVVASRLKTDEYIYPLINYHFDNAQIDNASRQFDVRYSLPALFYEWLLNEICVFNGYTLTNNIATLNDFDNTYLTLPCLSTEYDKKISERFIVNASSSANVASASISTGISTSEAVPIEFDIETVDDDNVLTTDTESLTFSGGSPESITASYYEAKVDGTYNFKSETSIEYIGGGVNVFLVIFKVVGSTAVGIAVEEQTLPATLIQAEFLLTFNADVELAQGERVFLMVYTPVTQVFTSLSGNTLEVNLLEASFSFGDTLYMRYLYKGQKVSEIIKYYLQAYCGLITVNEETKTVELTRFDAIQNNIATALDWSGKVDYTNKPNIEYAFNNYGQINNLKYSDDEHVIKPIGTDSTIDIDDETLESENDFIEVKFCASKMQDLLIDLPVPKIGIFVTDGTTTEEEEAEPRILYVEKKDATDFTDTSDLDYYNGTSTTSVSTSFPLAWFIKENATNNLGFGNNLIEDYYTGFEDVLDRTKIVSSNIRLNAVDINALDFLTPVYIAEYNCYFYISKISNYEYGSTQSTTVELVKLR